jgi:hypothetical protein
MAMQAFSALAEIQPLMRAPDEASEGTQVDGVEDLMENSEPHRSELTSPCTTIIFP